MPERRYEYAVCYRAGTGYIIPVTTSTAWEEGAERDLTAYRAGETEAGGDPDRLFIARRDPRWETYP